MTQSVSLEDHYQGALFGSVDFDYVTACASALLRIRRSKPESEWSSYLPDLSSPETDDGWEVFEL